MIEIEQLLDYLKAHELRLTTAESCTAGMVISLLAAAPGGGECMDCGYVVYSVASKRRLLGVRQQTIDTFNLTSEEVAREMAVGALRDSTANVAMANTGVAGPDPIDGIEPGTVCLAWAFQRREGVAVFSRTGHFHGDRQQVRKEAALFSLRQLRVFHERVLRGERE